MPVASPPRSPTVGPLPPVVVEEIGRRRREILAGVGDTGRVLDLDDPAFAGLIDGTTAVDSEDGAPFDLILSTGRLLGAPDLLWTLRALVARLASHGELVAVEPVGRSGTIGLLSASLGTCLPGVDGLQLSRDVPATVRAAGLTVVDLERFVVPTRLWPLRHFVQLRAICLPAAVADPAPSVAGPEPTP
ncbi:MAG TPA: hypothetical protein VIJ47_04500 [Acidimicrobiales bacterium]